MGTMTARGPAAGGTRYEDEQELDSLVAGQIVSRATHVVVKVRSSVWLGEDGWVIDRFLSGNAPRWPRSNATGQWSIWPSRRWFSQVSTR